MKRATRGYKKTQEEEFVWGHTMWYPTLPLPSALQVMLVLMVRWREVFFSLCTDKYRGGPTLCYYLKLKSLVNSVLATQLDGA
jgi:hypothetical protein